MNLVIIGTDNSSYSKIEELKSDKYMIKINGEYLIDRIIRIGRINGIKKVFCIINSHGQELKHYLSANKFGIPLKLIIQDNENYMHSLFALDPFRMKEPFFLITMDKVFIENEFSEFIAYSLLQENADGILAVTRDSNEKEPIYVAMNDEDIILKFSNSRDGYNWATGGIYYFLPSVFRDMEFALQAGISGLSKSLQLLIINRYILKGFSFSKIIKVERTGDAAKAENLITGNNNV